jgi:hypothetical protein
MNTATILDLIAARERAATSATGDPCGQIAKLTSELATIEAALADLQITRLVHARRPLRGDGMMIRMNERIEPTARR